MKKPHKIEGLNSWTWYVPGVGRTTMWDVTNDTWRTADEYARTGRRTLGYAFIPAGYRQPLFCGCDFGCPKFVAIDSLEAALSLLDFLRLREGDTDSEYFEHYTPKQLAWCNSRACETAARRVYELENPEV